MTAAALISIGLPAAAKDDPVPSPLVDAIEKCLTIRDDAARLQCSDAAARRLVDAVRKKDVMMIDREGVRTTRRSLFGFSLPKIGLFGSDGPDKGADEVAEITAKITRIADVGYGKYAITIDGGARWTTTEAWQRPPFPAVGQTITIRRAALGGYLVKIGSSGTVRAIRVG